MLCITVDCNNGILATKLSDVSIQLWDIQENVITTIIK
jgi:hypothetical protein